MTDPQPLTAEGEREVRLRHDQTHRLCLTCILLATLDRDRATPSVDGLREAYIVAMATVVRDHLPGIGGTYRALLCEALADAALAATPTPAPAPSDLSYSVIDPRDGGRNDR